jgi:hypothetical protein
VQQPVGFEGKSLSLIVILPRYGSVNAVIYSLVGVSYEPLTGAARNSSVFFG